MSEARRPVRESEADAASAWSVARFLEKHARRRGGADDWSRGPRAAHRRRRSASTSSAAAPGSARSTTAASRASRGRASTGGRGGSAAQALIFAEEQRRPSTRPRASWPRRSTWSAPALLHHGSEAQRQRYLRPLLRGDEVWCQLFSEPEAGSDLAALRTRAVRDGDDFVVNGQKLWTSSAQFCDFGILLARTDPEAPEAPRHHLLPRRHAQPRRRRCARC